MNIYFLIPTSMSTSKFIENLSILLNHDHQDRRVLSLIASLDRRIQTHRRIYKMDATKFILDRLNTFYNNCKKLEDLVNIYCTIFSIMENMANNKYLTDYSIIHILKNKIEYHEEYQRYINEFAAAMRYFQIGLIIREYSNGEMSVIKRFPRILVVFSPTEYYTYAVKSPKTYFSKLPADIKKILNEYVYSNNR